MISFRTFVISLSWTAQSTVGLFAGDLSTYRDFKLGMGLLDAEKRAQINASQVIVLHQRPALIQQIEWRPHYTRVLSEPDSVKDILLSFYNSELFRVVV